MSLILNGTNGVSDVDGSASTPAIRGTDTNTGMFFPAADTIAFAEGGTESMRLDSNGNVGIGTASPASQLDISRSGDAIVSLTSAGVQRYQLITRVGGRFDFQDQSAGATRWSVDQSGNLLVGRTSASGNNGRFQVTAVTNGPAADFLINSSSGSQNAVDITNAANSNYVAQRFWVNGYGGSLVGTISCTTTATSYNTSSDYRLKENIIPMTGALAKVQALKPCTYIWKSTGEQGEGFIAHELAEVVPDCVTGEKDAVDADGNPVYQGIDTSFLVATLTCAIQELKAELDTVKTELATLKGAA